MKCIINHLDAWLYVGIAVCQVEVDMLTGDTAKTLVDPLVLWVCVMIFKVLGAAFLAAKAYRSIPKKQDEAPVVNLPDVPAKIQPQPSTETKTT